MADRPMEWCVTHEQESVYCRSMPVYDLGYRGKCEHIPGQFVADDPGSTIASLANDPKARD